jgi:hypothetical protein
MVAEVVVAQRHGAGYLGNTRQWRVLFRTGRFSIGQEETGGKPVTTWVEE